MLRGYFHKRVIHPTELDGNYGSNVPDRSRKRSKRMPPKPNEVIAMCYEVLVERQYYADVAKRHNTSV